MNAFPYTNPYSQPVRTTQQQQRPPPFSSSQSVIINNNNALGNTGSTQVSLNEAVYELVHSNNNGSYRRSSAEYEHIFACQDWTLETASTFAAFVVQRLLLLQQSPPTNDTSTSAGSTDGATVLLQWLMIAMDQWSSEILYRVTVCGGLLENDSNNSGPSTVTLSTVLLDFVNSQSHCVAVHAKSHGAALVCLTTIWKVLEAMDACCTTWNEGSTSTTSGSSDMGSLWWVVPSETSKTSMQAKPTAYWQPAIDCALQYLLTDHSLNRQDTAECAAVRPEVLQRASVEFLTVLLQHGVTDWLFAAKDEAVSLLTETVCRHAARLNDPTMPVSSFTALSLACLSLLAVLESKGSSTAAASTSVCKLLRSTGLVSHLVAAAFPDAALDTSSSYGASAMPRWAQQSSVETTAGVGRNNNSHYCSPMHVLQVWKACGGETWSIVLQTTDARRWSNCARACWTAAAVESNNNSGLTPEQSVQLLFLYTNFRVETRQALAAVCAERDAHSNAAQPQHPSLLLNLLQSTDTATVALVRVLLQDRRCLATHDELSRSIWTAVDEHFVDACLQRVSHLEALQNDRASLLIVLDTLSIILASAPQLCQRMLLQRLQTGTIETLIQVMSPKNVVSMDADVSLDRSFLPLVEEETPPANNLSRLDETHHSFVEREEERQAQGLDSTVRMAVATVMAVWGTCSVDSTESRVSLLQGRMCEAVHSFVGDLSSSQHTASSGGQMQSLGSTRRYLRLLSALATPDNEEYLSGLIHSAQASQQRTVRELQSTVMHGKRLLNEFREKEKRLVGEKEAYARKLTSQAVTFQREKSFFRQTVAQTAKQQVEVHNGERSRAEQKLQELSTHVTQVEVRAAEAERVSQSCRDSESEARAALEQAMARLREFETKEQASLQRSQGRENELVRVKKELQSTKSSLGGLRKREKEMQIYIQQQDETLANTDESHGAMRDSLENLFGDMVSLSQMYELKEREAKTNQQDGNANEKKLARKVESEKRRYSELEERYQQIQHDNDALSKKYQRAREKLEDERKQRQKDADRRKRPGPVSYINQLHTSSVSEKSSRGRAHPGKENDSYSTSSTSQRRSKADDSYSTSSSSARRSRESQSASTASSSSLRRSHR